MRTPLRIGLVGFGTVGQGLYRLLNGAGNELAAVMKVCVKSRTKARSLPDGMFVYDPREIVEDPEIDVVVEVIDVSRPAYDIVCAAMSNGKPVVTANKKLIAENQEELTTLSHENNVPLLYEAAVCAGLPVINALENYYSALRVKSITGVLNASSHYVLKRMEMDGCDYSEAIRQSQELGYCESDPSLDMNGSDTLYKLCILAAHAFGAPLSPDDILVRGVESVTAQDISYARSNDASVKLIGHISLNSGKVRAWILPALIPADHPLYSLKASESGVAISGADSFGHHLISGTGAGGEATASGIVADLAMLSRGEAYRGPAQGCSGKLDCRDDRLPVVVRVKDTQARLPVGFADVGKTHLVDGYRFLAGAMSLKEIETTVSDTGDDPFVIVNLREEGSSY